VFCIYLRTTSELCHLQHKLIGFITEMKSVYCAVWTGSLNKAVCASSFLRVKSKSVVQFGDETCTDRHYLSTIPLHYALYAENALLQIDGQNVLHRSFVTIFFSKCRHVKPTVLLSVLSVLWLVLYMYEDKSNVF